MTNMKDMKCMRSTEVHFGNDIISKTRLTVNQFSKKQIAKLITATFQVHREKILSFFCYYYCSEDFLFKELQ